MGVTEFIILVLLAATLLALVLVLRRLQRVGPMVSAGPSAETVAASDTERTELDQLRQELREKNSELDQRRGELEALSTTMRLEHDELERELGRQRAALQERRHTINADHEALRQREADLITRLEEAGRREKEVDERDQALTADRDRLTAEADQLDADKLSHQQRVQDELERIAQLTAEQARAEVLSNAEHEARLQAARLARDIESEAQREAQRRARGIVVTAIQRMAVEHTAEAVVSVVPLPGEDMKGRIIGREGRNIRSFEQITGVTVMIDDTPETVLLSSFDPIRREVARLTLESLVADGRIHPSRIEEVHEQSTRQVSERCQRAAEDALLDVGITDLDPELVPILGSLKYRTSYGQNVLEHLVETAHLAGLMAAELGLDPRLTKRAAFLHDIGKALTHEVEGPHAEIGAELCQRHGEDPEVVHAIAAHHNEVEPETIEALLVQAADAISGSRPGARRESLQAYVKRLERLEKIALAHKGVDRAFAMQAGRELRIMVLPEQVDDARAAVIAREVAHTIEDELSYPGQIRVTVVRESRATETAH